jgi:hypothetical protein
VEVLPDDAVKEGRGGAALARAAVGATSSQFTRTADSPMATNTLFGAENERSMGLMMTSVGGTR